MDQETLEKRTYIVMHLLSSEDPAYSGINFFNVLMGKTRNRLMDNPHNSPSTDEAVYSIIKATVQKWILLHDHQWSEIAGSWHASDLYRALQAYNE